MLAEPPVIDPPALDPTAARVVRELKHTGPLLACRYVPGTDFVFTGGQDNLVVRWRLGDGSHRDLRGHQSWVRALAVQPGGDLFFSGDHAGNLLAWRHWDDSAEGPVYRASAHQGWIRSAAVSPDGRFLATAGNDRMVRIWNAADGTPIKELAGHECHVYNVRFHPAGQALVSADLKGIVKQWDTSNWQMTRQLDAAAIYKFDAGFVADIGGVRGMAFSRDGHWLACSGITEVSNAFAGVGNAAIVLLDWESGQIKHQLRPKENFQGVAWGVTFLPNGMLAGVGGGGGGGALWFWNPEQPQPVAEHKLPAAARDIDLSPDGQRLAVAFFDGQLRVYDLTAKMA